MNPDRLLRTLHGWLGMLILPWVVAAGLTGFYENHGDLVSRALPYAEFPTDTVNALLAEAPAKPVDAAGAAELAARLLPGRAEVAPVLLFDRPGFEAVASDKALRIDAATGTYALQGDFVTTFHRADGREVAMMVNWTKLLLRLHRAGWLSESLGTWPADLTALALILFGTSGLYIFFAPRLRRLRNRWRR